MVASLIVYGSLMAKYEIVALGVDLSAAMPVQVQGFRRVFAQEPSWRQGQGLRRAVLTVVRSPLDSFNGIMLSQMADSLFSDLDIRERGYHRQQISQTFITPFAGRRSLDLDDVMLYVGRQDRYNASLFPNRDYRERCIQASLEWGEAFYQGFCASTDRLHLT